MLGGRGFSASWETPALPTTNYLNNETWYDDIADGSVDAVITLPGEAAVNAVGAWLFTAPPDFAPDIYPLTSLLDIAEQVASVPLPSPITYPQDIEPLLTQASNLFFVSRRPGWTIVHNLVQSSANLGKNNAGAKTERSNVRDAILNAAGQMREYKLTARQEAMLQKWVDGSFNEQPDPARPAPSPTADLDRTSLGHCVGGGFLPGIEAGTVLREASIYSEFGRITRGQFSDYDGTNYQMEPGLISSRMACPWQADFTECAKAWWPAQRPDLAGRPTSGSAQNWDRGIIVNGDEGDSRSHKNMVDHCAAGCRASFEQWFR
ncbi:hypothetical protein AJ87_14715 [Rhizobium yanglingense]|nr:hypothetical protein AJ87_14715 [Rhizobium yanglingense]